MKKLIINADDLGLTPGVTEGIIHAHQKGVVTSTSALMNSPHISSDLPRARRACPGLGIGAHLVITEGNPLLPVSQVPSLVNDRGEFHELHHQPGKIRELNLDEICAEWQTQIDYFLGFGFQPDHLDSHHHISYFNPAIFEVMVGLAKSNYLPIRFPPPEFIEPLGVENISQMLAASSVKAPGACITSFYEQDNSVSLENLLRIITALGDEPQEIMCHPGYADQELIDSCSYSTPREKELEILSSREVLSAIENEGVELISFSRLVSV